MQSPKLMLVDNTMRLEVRISDCQDSNGVSGTLTQTSDRGSAVHQPITDNHTGLECFDN